MLPAASPYTRAKIEAANARAADAFVLDVIIGTTIALFIICGSVASTL